MDTSLLEDEDEFLNHLWYGNEGTGKTSHLAAAASQGKVLIVRAEAGIKRRALMRLGVPIENIHLWPAKGEDLTFEGLEQLFWDVHTELQEDSSSWYLVGWDSITEIAAELLEAARDEAIELQAKAHMDKDRFFTDRDDYGHMSNRVRFLLRRYAKDLPCHFAVTALERRDQDDDGTVRYGPSITPALQNDLMGIMDSVGHTYVIETDGVTEFMADFRPVDKYRSKERMAGAIPKKLILPTFPRILAYANEEMTTDDDPEFQEARARRDKLKQEREALKSAGAAKKAPASKRAAPKPAESDEDSAA